MIRAIKKYNIWILAVVGFFFLACNNNVIDKSSDKPNQEKRENSISKTFSKRDSINKLLNWRELNCGLWINKNDEIGLKTFNGIDLIDGIHSDIYLTKSGEFNISDIIDTSSFKSLGNYFYKDVNNIYYHYTMADGGYFNLRHDIDYKSFQIMDDCYAKDKHKVYDYRGRPIEDIDYSSFRTDTAVYGCFAKDKNHYYTWGDTLSKEEMKDSIVMEAIKILNK